MAAKIRIGLIGYGGWTRTAYLPALEADGRAGRELDPNVYLEACSTFRTPGVIEELVAEGGEDRDVPAQPDRQGAHRRHQLNRQAQGARRQRGPPPQGLTDPDPLRPARSLPTS